MQLTQRRQFLQAKQRILVFCLVQGRFVVYKLKIYGVHSFYIKLHAARFYFFFRCFYFLQFDIEVAIVAEYQTPAGCLVFI